MHPWVGGYALVGRGAKCALGDADIGVRVEQAQRSYSLLRVLNIIGA